MHHYTAGTTTALVDYQYRLLESQIGSYLDFRVEKSIGIRRERKYSGHPEGRAMKLEVQSCREVDNIETVACRRES